VHGIQSKTTSPIILLFKEANLYMHQCLKRHITVTESRFVAEHDSVVYHGMWIYSQKCWSALCGCRC